MKNILAAVLVLLSCTSINAQAPTTTTAFPATTTEEYNMGAIGYKLFLQMGVEIKQGYKINAIADYEYGDRKASFKGLYRPGGTKPCCVIMVYTKMRGAPEYYCIPTVDAPEELWDRFRMAINGETDVKAEQMQFFSFAIAKAAMLFATK